MSVPAASAAEDIAIPFIGIAEGHRTSRHRQEGDGQRTRWVGGAETTI